MEVVRRPRRRNDLTRTFSAISPAKPTEVYDTFWRFAYERQNVFFRRLEGVHAPWTRDPILNTYKFTNAYRAADRVSQYLIRHVLYRGSKDVDEVFFRTLLFKLFNKIETWQLLESQLGEIQWQTYRYADYDKILSAAVKSGASIYSAAYIMASGNELFGVDRKYQGHLRLIERMMSDAAAERLTHCRSMRLAFELLRSYPLIGDFLAYQLVTDLNYSELTEFSEMEFTMPGPGARDGIHKCFETLGGLSEIDIIRLMADRQEEEFARLKLDFKTLWGRPLQLIDIQNLFCEVDKYARLKHPSIRGISGRKRVKQKYRARSEPIDYFFPPKWRLNVNRNTAGSRVTP